MTDAQKEQVTRLRLKGEGYMKISSLLGISINTIRSYCRRNEIDGCLSDAQVRCKQCNKAIRVISGQKPRKFCSDECRKLWWNSHLSSVNRKANYNFVCACCGKEFTAYGNSSRKYCSRVCYIAGRYGKGSEQVYAVRE